MKMTAMLLIKKYLFVLSTDTTWKESMIDRKIYAIKFLFEKGLVIVCVDPDINQIECKYIRN